MSVNGVTGIAVDSTGNLVVALAWCGRQPDRVTVYHRRDRGGAVSPTVYVPPAETDVDPEITDAVYSAPHLEGGTASFRIDLPDNGWKTKSKPSAFDPAITYSVFGGANDNSASTTHVSFQLGDAEELKRRPGMVLIYGDDPQAGEGSDVFISQEEFNWRGKEESCSD